MVKKVFGTRRRDLLKGSLAIGGVAAMGSPAAGQSAPAGTQQQRDFTPNPARAQMEAGPVGADATSNAAPGAHVIRNPGSDYMVDLLKAAGIKYVAAMPGSTFRGLQESIVNYGRNADPELIVCVHEEVSAAICHGYAKVAGKPMACLVHSNVGLQHASMAIYNAWCDRVPMIVIAGNVLDATKRRPGVEWAHTAEDVGALVRDYIKWDDTPVSLRHYGESFMRGVQLTMTPPCEPVLLVADSELQEAEAADRAHIVMPRLAVTSPPAGDSAAIALAADMLVRAERPVIVVDRLARTPRGTTLLVEFAELLGAPVVDRGGRMNMPNTHPLYQTGRETELVAGADVVLGLELTDVWGVVNRLADTIERESRRLAPVDCKVIAISANYAYVRSNMQDAQRYYAADLTLAADGEACLPQLIAAVRSKMTAAHRQRAASNKSALEAAFRRTRAADAEAAAIGWDASPISTARLAVEVWNRIKSLNWGLVSSTQVISSWPQRLWDITEHHHFIGNEGGYGLGYGLAASVGAAMAHRDAGRIAVAIQTDGDVLMLPGAFWTLAHHNLPILIVMHNNRAWHQETMHLTRMANRRDRGPGTWKIGTVITEPHIDYAAVARGMGVWAEGPIEDPNRLGAALDHALEVVKSGKPALLDVVTQPR